MAIEIDASQEIWMPQTLAIGQTAKAATYSILECDSTALAFLPPRMTTTQRNAIGGGVANPATGTIIYNTSTNMLNQFNGTAWQQISATTTVGLDQAVEIVDALGGTHNFTFTDGILTAYST